MEQVEQAGQVCGGASGAGEIGESWRAHEEAAIGTEGSRPSANRSSDGRRLAGERKIGAPKSNEERPAGLKRRRRQPHSAQLGDDIGPRLGGSPARRLWTKK